MHNPVTRVTVSVGDARLSMLVAGPERGEPVVLLHGIPASAELWRTGLSELSAAGFRAYAPDLPGYGQTRLPARGDRSLRGAAILLAAWLLQAQIPPVWLIGHDLGGGVAQILSVAYPERIARLTLSHAAIEANWPVEGIAVARMLARLGLFPTLAAVGLFAIDPYTTREIKRTVLNRAVLKRGDPRRQIFYDGKFNDAVGRREFAAHLLALDNAQTLAVARQLWRVSVPALLLWGLNDPFQPWERTGQRLKQLLPHAQIRLIEQASHFVMLDQPQAFYQALLDWRRAAVT